MTSLGIDGCQDDSLQRVERLQLGRRQPGRVDAALHDVMPVNVRETIIVSQKSVSEIVVSQRMLVYM